MNRTLNEAQEKMKSLIRKAESLSISRKELFQLASSHKLSHPSSTAPSCSRSVLISVLVLVISVALALQGSVTSIYQARKILASQQCLFATPDALSRFFRPPVSCSICNGVSEVVKVSKIPVDDFEKRYAYTGIPVIITDATENWTAPQVFSFDFFQNLYKENMNTVSHQCQFFPYKTNFQSLEEFLNLTSYSVERSTPWYVGWSNCDVKVTEVLRQHYQRPYFLPQNAEGKRLDWIFMGSKGYGAPMHVDNVEYPSWQAQLGGKKKWTLQPPPECFYICNSLEVTVETGETIVLDTNRWYHSTEIVSEDMSITIGAEFD